MMITIKINRTLLALLSVAALSIVGFKAATPNKREICAQASAGVLYPSAAIRKLGLYKDNGPEGPHDEFIGWSSFWSYCEYYKS